MARVFNNVLISGVRGRLGNQLVFRVVNGVTIVSHAPAKPDRRKETEAQRKTRTTFRAATQWAKSQLIIHCYWRTIENQHVTVLGALFPELP